MKKSEHQNWITNIENTARAINFQLGSEVVDSVYKKYGARSLWDLNPNYFPDVFSELYAIESDLR